MQVASVLNVAHAYWCAAKEASVYKHPALRDAQSAGIKMPFQATSALKGGAFGAKDHALAEALGISMQCMLTGAEQVD